MVQFNKLNVFILIGVIALVSGKSIDQEDNNKPKPYAWLFDSPEYKAQHPKDQFNPENTFTSCGGLFSGTQCLNYLNYQPTGGYLPNTRCVYAIHSNMYSQIEIHVDSISTTTGISGLTVFTTGSSGMTAHRVPNVPQTSYTFSTNSRPVYIMFSSNTEGSGDGFSIGFQSSGSLQNYIGAEKFINGSSGTMTSHLESYADNERSTFIVQPPREQITTVQITGLNSEASCDYLNIYTLIPYHASGSTITPLSYSGNYPFGPPDSETSSPEPRILYFTSDSSIVGTGFSFQWSSV